MSDLLVGCRVEYHDEGENKEGIVVKVDRSQIGSGNAMALILKSDGSVDQIYATILNIHPDDVKFITLLSKNYKLRKKIIENKTERFEIMDL